MSLDRLKSKIEEFVDEHLPKEPPPRGSRSKIIHECIWGTNLFSKDEINFIDTRLLQRLRRIHQTGLAYFTYPTAIHTRFDHTLGTIIQCSRLTDELIRKQKLRNEELLTKEHILPLRLSALFHDCGHGIFSHTSEELYALLNEIQEATMEGNEFENSPQPHELLSSLIVQSERFKLYFNKVGLDCDVAQLPKCITGNESDSRKYISDILYSIFDGDKIDYIHRDAHFSGLPLRIDLDRLWYGIDIKEIPIGGKKYTKLSISHTATEPLEQIMFHRTMLYPTLYQHQKVRSCDCMFKGIIEYIRKMSSGVKMGNKIVTFKNVEDFLYGTDDEFLNIGMNTNDANLKRLFENLLYRKLFHRVILISARTVADEAAYAEMLNFRNDKSPEAYKERRNIAEEICRQANNKGIKVLPEEIWLDLPENVKSSRDAEEAFVFVNHDTKDEFIPAKDIFPISDWVRQIDIHKWEGSLFAPAELQEKIAPIAKDVIENRFKCHLTEEAFTGCHGTVPA